MTIDISIKNKLTKFMRFVEGIYIAYPKLSQDARELVNIGKINWLEYVIASSPKINSAQTTPDWIKGEVEKYMNNRENENILLGMTGLQEFIPDKNNFQGVLSYIGLFPENFIAVYNTYNQSIKRKGDGEWAIGNKIHHPISFKSDYGRPSQLTLKLERDTIFSSIKDYIYNIPFIEKLMSEGKIQQGIKFNTNIKLPSIQDSKWSHDGKKFSFTMDLDEDKNIIYLNRDEETYRKGIIEKFGYWEKTLENNGAVFEKKAIRPSLDKKEITDYTKSLIPKINAFSGFHSSNIYTSSDNLHISGEDGYQTLNSIVENMPVSSD